MARSSRACLEVFGKAGAVCPAFFMPELHARVGRLWAVAGGLSQFKKYPWLLRFGRVGRVGRPVPFSEKRGGYRDSRARPRGLRPTHNTASWPDMGDRAGKNHY
jgi:hypothetical protein